MGAQTDESYTDEDRDELRRRVLLKIADPETARWAQEARQALLDGSIRDWS
jgi:hypothetical protein